MRTRSPLVTIQLSTYTTPSAQFGAIQDVYMPKDATKQARRGIGFITFAAPEAVERVMRQHHSLAGQELVVDKAAPKTKDSMGGGHLGGLYRGASSGQLNGRSRSIASCVYLHY